MYCNSCRSHNPDNALYCNQCGKRLETYVTSFNGPSTQKGKNKPLMLVVLLGVALLIISGFFAYLLVARDSVGDPITGRKIQRDKKMRNQKTKPLIEKSKYGERSP